VKLTRIQAQVDHFSPFLVAHSLPSFWASKPINPTTPPIPSQAKWVKNSIFLVAQNKQGIFFPFLLDWDHCFLFSFFFIK